MYNNIYMSKNISGTRIINTEENDNESEKEEHSDTDQSEKSYDSEDSEEEKDCYYEDIIENELTINQIKIDDNINLKIIKGKDRKSFPKMTKYEMVRIIGERIKQLTLGSKSFIKNKEDFNYEQIAYEEFKNKLIPFKIIRNLPNNQREEWKISELEISHLI